MAGNKKGGIKAARVNLARHGEDFYQRIGAIGGKASGKGGFAYSKRMGLNQHIEAGRLEKELITAKEHKHVRLRLRPETETECLLTA